MVSTDCRTIAFTKIQELINCEIKVKYLYEYHQVKILKHYYIRFSPTHEFNNRIILIITNNEIYTNLNNNI